MGSSALRPRLNDKHRGHRSTHAAGDANDDVESRRAEPTKGSVRGLRRRRCHYSRGSKFPGTLLPHATAPAALTRGVGVVGAALCGASLTIVRRLLDPPSSSRTTGIGAVGVAAIAGVADVEDRAANPTALADDVEYWTITDRWATSASRLCCVWMTQMTARGPVSAGPLPFLPPSSPTGPPIARFRPGPSIRFGFQPPLTRGGRADRDARAAARRRAAGGGST